MTDLSTTIIGSGIKTGLKEIAKAKAKDDVNRTLLNSDGKVANAMATLLNTAIDGVYDMAVKGGVSSPTLLIAVVKNSAAMAGLSSSQKLECASALLALGGEGLSFSGQLGVAAGAELATAGLATPVVAVQAGLLVKTGLDVVNSAIKANQQCGPLVVEGYSSLQADWSNFAGSLELSITNAVMTQSSPPQ